MVFLTKANYIVNSFSFFDIIYEICWSIAFKFMARVNKYHKLFLISSLHYISLLTKNPEMKILEASKRALLPKIRFIIIIIIIIIMDYLQLINKHHLLILYSV